MPRITPVLSIVSLTLASVLIIGLQIKLFGWIVFGIGLLLTILFSKKQFRKDILLIYISVAFLGVTPISTDISYYHFAQMMFLLACAILVPYCISRYIYKDHHIRLKTNLRGLSKNEMVYVFLTGLTAYLFLPLIFRLTETYHSWVVSLEASYLITFFIGINLVGIWDELFFMNTVLGVLRRHVTFPVANLIQSILATSFLYQLGFRSWSFLVIFFFIFLQGYVFRRSNSLALLIAIHLVVDLILFLALIHAYYPSAMPIFIIR